MHTSKAFSVFSFCLIIVFGYSATLSSAAAQQQEKRVALVIGNGAYAKGPLATTANDAGLVAQNLQAAGFDVIGARDLDADSLRKTFRDFMQKVESDPANTVAMVYLSGYGVQLAGENYFIPVDSTINRDTDIPIEGLRVSDYTRELASVPLKVSIFVLDAARQQPFIEGGNPIASGLALVDPAPNSLIAFNAAPGTVAPSESGPYGAYAQALAEMIRTGGLPLPDVFDRVRLRVSENTKGGQIPWNAQNIQAQFTFFNRAPDAPPVQGTPDQVAAIRERPMRDLGAQEAFTAALTRDTMPGYEDFLAAYPGDPLARRVRAIVAARREAITWRRSYLADTPDAYWSYLRRYPSGPHAWDARRRLAFLSAALEPPPTFAMLDYDLPPPPPDEVVFVDRPVFYFDDPDFAFAPPPPPPLFFLPPPPLDFVVLAPPFAPVGLFILPQPVFVPVPAYIAAPVYVAPPPNNIIFNNIHNTTIINNTINVAPTPQNNIAAAAASGQTGAGPQVSTSLKTKAAAISSGQAAIPPNTLVNTNAKTSTKQVFPVSATSTSTTTTPPPPGTATKPQSGNQQQGTGPRQGTGTQPGKGTPQGTKAPETENLKPGNALPGSPSGAVLPAQTGKGNEASKGGVPNATGPVPGVTPPGAKLAPDHKSATNPTTMSPGGSPSDTGNAGKPKIPTTTAPVPSGTNPSAKPTPESKFGTTSPARSPAGPGAGPGASGGPKALETERKPDDVSAPAKPATPAKPTPPVAHVEPQRRASPPPSPSRPTPQIARPAPPPPRAAPSPRPAPQVARPAPPPPRAAPPPRPAPQVARPAPPPPRAAPPPRPAAPAAAKKCPPNVAKC